MQWCLFLFFACKWFASTFYPLFLCHNCVTVFLVLGVESLNVSSVFVSYVNGTILYAVLFQIIKEGQSFSKFLFSYRYHNILASLLSGRLNRVRILDQFYRNTHH